MSGLRLSPDMVSGSSMPGDRHGAGVHPHPLRRSATDLILEEHTDLRQPVRRRGVTGSRSALW
jgi:hypothetical protein